MKHSEVTKTEIVWLALNPNLLKERERFWSKVLILGDSDCWEWTGGLYKRSTKGLAYGAFKSAFFGNNVVAHRMAFLFTHGFITRGNHVHLRHLCNNGKCCNPSHLAIGTPAENAHDRVLAGTQPKGDMHYARLEPWRLSRGDEHRKAHANSVPRGSNCKRAKLTEDIVAQARRDYDPGICTIKILSERYGVGISVMASAISGNTWKHVSEKAKHVTSEDRSNIRRIAATVRWNS